MGVEQELKRLFQTENGKGDPNKVKDGEEEQNLGLAVLDALGLTGQAARDNLGGALGTDLVSGSNSAMQNVLEGAAAEGSLDPRMGVLLAARSGGGNTATRAALAAFRGAVPDGKTPGQAAEEVAEVLPPKAVAAALRYHAVKQKIEALMTTATTRPQRLTQAMQSELPLKLQECGVMTDHGKIAALTYKRVNESGSSQEKDLLTSINAWADALADESKADAEICELDSAVEAMLGHIDQG